MASGSQDGETAPTLPHLLRASSRTFAIGIERLPGRLRHAMTVAYLLLRVSDYLEDNERMRAERKAELLRLWDRVLGGEAGLAEVAARMEIAEPLTPDAVVAKHAATVLDGLEALPADVRRSILRHVRDSTRGMARWTVRGPDIAGVEELDDYMHEVAGRVGYLVTELFCHHSRLIRRRRGELLSRAREFGLGLQTVNVIRGFRTDYERGWIYVPESMAARHGLEREALFEPRNSAAALEVLNRLADKAERHLEAAREYVQHLPRVCHSVRLFCLFPLFFAIRTLAVGRRSDEVLFSEAKISRDEVRRIARAATLGGWSNRWIDRYCDKLRTAERI